MALLTAYTFRNAFKRRLTSLVTIIGIALVVFVGCAVFMLANGLRQMMVDSGYEDNVIIVRRASQSEVSSILPRSQGNIARTDPAIALDEAGVPMIAGEITVLISQPRRDNNEEKNLTIRGVSEMSFAVRPRVVLTEGRMFKQGTAEVVVGSKVARDFKGCRIGETVRFASRDWNVVGVFEADGASVESELWGSYDQLTDAFSRPIYSSLTAKLKSPEMFGEMRQRLENDPQLSIEVHREKDYYSTQTNSVRTFVKVLGWSISVLFSLGIIVGAMITMYGAVANRTKEIGTLRALGFSRFSILLSFLVESVLISLIGGGLGIAGAYFLRFVEVSTTNWDTFSELVFTFEASGWIVIGALSFAIIMGFIGGFLPAVRAARLRIINALRAR